MRAVSVLILAATMCAAGEARASMQVIGGTIAKDCYRAAKSVDAAHGVSLCTLAIDNEFLSPRDLAATYDNRGTLYVERRAFEAARQDFERAIALDPALGEPFVNHGAVLIWERDYSGAIAEITHGLAMSPGEPEKAYYNRALAYEYSGDLKAAYADYEKAAELKPDWAQPKTDLARFSVKHK